MTGKTIEIIISASGETRLQTKGFAGQGCREASRMMEAALGQRMAEALTPEFHALESQQQSRLNQQS